VVVGGIGKEREREQEQEREREREQKKEVNIMVRPRIFANFGYISALVRPTNARIFIRSSEIRRESRNKRERGN
jgi:hypothetical protein